MSGDWNFRDMPRVFNHLAKTLGRGLLVICRKEETMKAVLVVVANSADARPIYVTKPRATFAAYH